MPKISPESVATSNASESFADASSAGNASGDYATEHAARVSAEAAVFIRDRVLSIVSHDLRGPLNAIHSWAHVLERKLASEDPGIARAIAGIRTGVEQQVKLIEDVIDKTRSKTRHLTLTVAPTQVGPLVDAELANIRATVAESRHVTIRSTVALEDVEAEIDATRFAQAIWAMLAYAVEVVEPGGVVDFDAQAGEAGIEIGVSFVEAVSDPVAAHLHTPGIFADSPTNVDNGALPLALPARVAAAHEAELSNEVLDDGRRRVAYHHPARRGHRSNH